MGVKRDLTQKEADAIALLGQRHSNELVELLEALGISPDCMVRIVFDPCWKTNSNAQAVRVISTVQDIVELRDLFVFLAHCYEEERVKRDSVPVPGGKVH